MEVELGPNHLCLVLNEFVMEISFHSAPHERGMDSETVDCILETISFPKLPKDTEMPAGISKASR